MFSKSKRRICTLCNVTWFLSTVCGALVLYATIVGVFYAHFGTGQAIFGTMSGSLSLIALIACLFFVKKIATEDCTCVHTPVKK